MKTLIVGLGSMGKRRIRNLKSLGQQEVMGVDPRPDRRDEAARLYSIRTFAELEQAMVEGPDALIISTPPDMHMGPAKAAVEAGRPFFSEASITAAGMADVLALADHKSLVAAASCTMRHHPSVRKMKEIVAAGGIGKVLAFTHHCGQWLPDWHLDEDYRKFYVSRRETGACREIVPFELTWLNWIVDDEVGRVAAMKAKLSSLDCDIDDIYQLVMQYSGGTIGHLQIDVLARAAVRHCRIVGSEGTLEWSLTEGTVRHFQSRTKQWTVHAEPKPRVEKGYSEMSDEAMYESEMQAFLDAIAGRKPWDNPLRDEISVLAMLTAAERAAETGITQQL